MNYINRRHWLKQAGIMSAGLLLPEIIFALSKKQIQLFSLFQVGRM